MQTVQLGPFDVGSQEGWQQFAATLGALGGMPPAGGPAGAQPAAGAAAAAGGAGARASPFNFGNIFGGASGGNAAPGGRGGRGRGGTGQGAGHGAQAAAAQQQAAAWWQSMQQELARQLSGMNALPPGGQHAHLFDGLHRLLHFMEVGSERGAEAAAAARGRGRQRQRARDEENLPAIQSITEGEGQAAGGGASFGRQRSLPSGFSWSTQQVGAFAHLLLACSALHAASVDKPPGRTPPSGLILAGYLAALPAQQAAAWRRALPGWQQNCVAAARSVLESAQLSGATRAAVNRVLEAAGAEPLRWGPSGVSATGTFICASSDRICTLLLSCLPQRMAGWTARTLWAEWLVGRSQRFLQALPSVLQAECRGRQQPGGAPHPLLPCIE